MSVVREEEGVQVLSESVKSLWKLRMQVYVVVLIFLSRQGIVILCAHSAFYF
jgi:hypothetical protein